MNLVWKETPRGRIERPLNAVEKESLLHVFSHARKPSQADLRIANAVLDEMDRKELWIECDCVEPDHNHSGPYNCEVKGASLRHVKTSRRHDEACPLYRMKKDRDADSASHEGKTSPLNPIGGDDWLPDRKEKARIKPGDEPAQPRKARRKPLKPVPALGRKLLTLIQAAGLNQLELGPAYHAPGLAGAIQSIKDVLEAHTMKNGIILADLISCSPWMPSEKIEEMLVKLETSGEVSRNDKEICVYVVGLATVVSREEVNFSVRGKTFTHTPETRVTINGENSYNAGSRGPYWTILEYRRDGEGLAYCHDGYAHAALSLDNPVPVDSNLEKLTLKTIINACEFASRKTNHPEALSLSKPLFTMKALKDGSEEIIHPDFILNVAPAGKQTVNTLIIETMGYDSDDYIERKANTHNWMREVGTLLTDPPDWPEPTQTTFNSVLLKHIFRAGK
ncbi:hypothetical protein HVX06_21550 (plasmid) [Enterobacter sp. RHB15-C17]|nr:hypothetical protein HVX06_21550 [Enterobacter sp. RHB15-C17]